jgi:hypothetical protein
MKHNVSTAERASIGGNHCHVGLDRVEINISDGEITANIHIHFTKETRDDAVPTTTGWIRTGKQ